MNRVPQKIRGSRGLAGVLLAGWVGWAGSAGVPMGTLNPTAGPTAAASQMYTLTDLYNQLDTGVTGSKAAAFTEPASGPAGGSGFKTLDEVMAKMPVVDATDGAVATNVLSSKKFWGLTSGAWGLQTGTNPPAPVPRTGQTSPSDSGTDGALQKGAALPSPRFTDNNNGTVTDNLTGLIWLQNANCANASRNWATALADVVSLNGTGKMNNNICGDTSNSGTYQTDWRLPNVRELYSLIDLAYLNPALATGHPFLDVQSANYWSSTSVAGATTTNAWNVNLGLGNVRSAAKTTTVDPYYVWPVRGGQ